MNYNLFEQKKKNKLQSLYETKMKELKKENKILKSRLNDKKENLRLNHEILYCTLENIFMNSNIIENNKIQSMITKSKIINKKLFSLINDKSEKEKIIYIIKKEIPEIKERILEQINILKNEANLKNKEISSDELAIKKLKIELEKIRRSAFFKKARTEIKVAPPTPSSVEVNIELINAKKLFTKASNMHKDKKKKSEDLWKEEKNLKDEVKKIKNNIIKENKINQDDIIPFFDNMGYNPDIEKYEKEEEEESEDDEGPSDDENDEGKSKNKKSKEKELKVLNEQFTKLKNKVDENENKINEYKKSYKIFKIRIENIKYNNNIKK